MKFSTTALLFGLLASSSEAFTGSKLTTRRAFAARSSSTYLNMVAADAKVILVTGSSRGLGKSIAVDLGKHGQKVVVNYVSDNSKGAAEATVAEIKALGGDSIAVKADSKYLKPKVQSSLRRIS